MVEATYNALEDENETFAGDDGFLENRNNQKGELTRRNSSSNYVKEKGMVWGRSGYEGGSNVGLDDHKAEEVIKESFSQPDPEADKGLGRKAKISLLAGCGEFVDAVIARFLGHARLETSEIIEAHHNANIIEHQMYLDQLTSQLDDGKKRGDELREANKAIQGQNFWMGPFEDLDRPQLLQRRPAIAKLKNDMEMEMATIVDVSSRQFYMGSSLNQGMITTDMELDVGYVVPSMMAPPPVYNLDPAEESMVIPAEEYVVNPTEGTNINSAEEYIVNHAEGNNINPSEEDNVIHQGNDIPDAAPGFGGPYNIIDPEVNDILDVAGFGGYVANPPGNDNIDSLDKILKGFDGFFYS
ncbi:hypothetical protein V6N12_013155 [Hibiscus sabdariffa]|uniref:Uncharacterized protein n=1 Tax=Hibiscus sabdariffa TaxID=183260 RepID=A0ABR1Z731_9ROSI